jgi:ribosomal protein S12 methylthiotransferase
MAVKVGMVSLGCSKNQVDAEILLALMVNNGYEICADAQQCDVVIINTCGFIEDAKRESIETIFEFAQLKNQGQVKVLVVTGCLAERYRDQLVSEIPEADVVLGIGSNTQIAQAVQKALDGQRVSALSPGDRHAPYGDDRRTFRLSEDCRGLRQPMQLLCHPADSRRIPLPQDGGHP